MKPRVLIAGIGNIFLQDDGFGVEVAHRLGAETLPEVVRVADFGIRGIHLAYELLERKYELTILVDAMVRGDRPGTLYLVEPDLESLGDGGGHGGCTCDDPSTRLPTSPVNRGLAGTGIDRRM